MVIVVSVCSEWKPGPRSSAVDERGQVVLKDHNLSSAGSDTFFCKYDQNMTKNTIVEMLRNFKWYSKITTSVQKVLILFSVNSPFRLIGKYEQKYNS